MSSCYRNRNSRVRTKAVPTRLQLFTNGVVVSEGLVRAHQARCRERSIKVIAAYR